MNKIEELEERIYALESLLNVVYERTIDVDANREHWGEETITKTVYRCKLGCTHDTIAEARDHLK